MGISERKIADEVRKVIAKVARIDENLIKEDSSLRKDLWIDSLQAVQISSLLEDVFDIKIDETEMFNVDSLNDIVDLIEEYKGTSSGR